MNLRFNCKTERYGECEVYLPVVPVILKGEKGHEPLNFTAILDTGSPFVLIPREIADALGLAYDSTKTESAKGYNGDNFTTTKSKITITLRRGREKVTIDCICMIQLDGDREHEHLIIGSSFFEHVRVDFDYPNKKFYVKGETKLLRSGTLH
jgi:predicted aspartyl protease